MKRFSKRRFACEADSQKEIEEFLNTKGKKLKYHSVNFHIEMNEKRKSKKLLMKIQKNNMNILLI